MEEVYEFLKKCETYYLAMVEDGKPKVRPFGTVDIWDGKLYIQTGKVKEVSKQIHENPSVEICAFDGKKWIRLSGKLLADDRRDAKKHMLDQYPVLRSMYNEDDGNTEVFYFVDATAVFCSFIEPPKTVTF